MTKKYDLKILVERLNELKTISEKHKHEKSDYLTGIRKAIDIMEGIE